MERKIRLRQLIVPFGPGSIYIDKEGSPLIIHGLDLWFKRIYQVDGRNENSENIIENDYIINERRLEKLLKVKKFKTPPDFIQNSPYGEPAANHSLAIPVSRFPTWYRNRNTNELRRVNPLEKKIDKEWVAVRFVCVCENGHITDFPWKEWIKCKCPDNSGLILEDRGGSDLSSILIKCRKCPPGSEGQKGRTLAQTSSFIDTDRKETMLQREGIRCPGEKPWLDNIDKNDNCDAPLVVALINQSNLYFPKIVSSIKIPEKNSRENTNNEIEKILKMNDFDTVSSIFKSNMQREDKLKLLMLLMDKEKIKISKSVMEKLIDNPEIIEEKHENDANHEKPSEPEIIAFRREEYNILSEDSCDMESNADIVVSRAEISEKATRWFSRINIVEKLKETMVFAGFERLNYRGFTSIDMPEAAIHKLFAKYPREPWLPAIETHGEGIFIEFNNEYFMQWFNNQNDWLNKRIENEFIEKLEKTNIFLIPQKPVSRIWTTMFLVAHSLAHILIRQITYESGYGSASLKERLYISDNSKAPMMGMLIYTASGDSEGSLGGLARLGHPDKFIPLLKKALIKASWCSSDPLCSENKLTEMANLAACHACIMLPETSCEIFNQGLDRILIVGSPQEREKGYFHELI